MADVAEAVRQRLAALVGLRLAASYRAADMRIFHFGKMRTVERGAVGEYALHVQCPWRIETRDAILTGRHDLFEPAVVTEGFDWESWDWDGAETLQDRIVSEFMMANECTVERVLPDDHGGVAISMSGGFSLVLFPAGSRSEDWRVFKPSTDGHFVISGGRVEEADKS